jgi:prepilin-type N-terminal cleavage/methylation domain-containing protein
MQLRQEHGFTLAEMLVSLGMFAVLGMSFISFSTSALHTLSSEDRAALATQ